MLLIVLGIVLGIVLSLILFNEQDNIFFGSFLFGSSFALITFVISMNINNNQFNKSYTTTLYNNAYISLSDKITIYDTNNDTLNNVSLQLSNLKIIKDDTTKLVRVDYEEVVNLRYFISLDIKDPTYILHLNENHILNNGVSK